jgi:hypothetical protein
MVMTAQLKNVSLVTIKKSTAPRIVNTRVSSPAVQATTALNKTASKPAPTIPHAHRISVLLRTAHKEATVVTATMFDRKPVRKKCRRPMCSTIVKERVIIGRGLPELMGLATLELMVTCSLAL